LPRGRDALDADERAFLRDADPWGLILFKRNVESRDLSSFVKLAMQEFQRLNEFNIARYRLHLSEYWAWYRALHSAIPGS